MAISQRLRVVELWGGPGSGKSTTAAGLFARLKLDVARDLAGKVSVELITEYAKQVTWLLAHWYPHGRPSEEAVRRALGQRQAALFGEQWGRLAQLVGQVDVAISDSPLWLCAHYCDPVLYPREAWSAVIAAHYAQIEVLHVWVRRVKPYETRGRNETEEQAREIDRALRVLWRQAPGGEIFEVDGDEGAPAQIRDELLRRGWIVGA